MNAGGPPGRLSYFRQFMHKYPFQVVISESPVINDFCLPRYELFYSYNGNGIHRSLLGVRKGITSISHAIYSHPDNECVAPPVTFSRQTFVVVRTDVPPSTRFG